MFNGLADIVRMLLVEMGSTHEVQGRGWRATLVDKEGNDAIVMYWYRVPGGFSTLCMSFTPSFTGKVERLENGFETPYGEYSYTELSQDNLFRHVLLECLKKAHERLDIVVGKNN